MERLIRKTTAQQVAHNIEVSILNGEFVPGERLPTERQMSAQLGCSRVTLREGLSMLTARGLLISVPGAGTFVTTRELAQSLDAGPSLYVTTKVPQRRLEIIRYFLEFRRALLADTLGFVCERASNDDLASVLEGLDQIGVAARHYRNVERAADLELRVIHMAAEVGDARFFWLAINMVRQFFRVARAELVPALRLEDFAKRAEVLSAFIRKRDAAGVRQWVRAHYLAADSRTLAALSARAAKRPQRPAEPLSPDVERTVSGAPPFVIAEQVDVPLAPPSTCGAAKRDDGVGTAETLGPSLHDVPREQALNPPTSASPDDLHDASKALQQEPGIAAKSDDAASAEEDEADESGTLHDPTTLLDAEPEAGPVLGDEDNPYISSWEGTPGLPRTNPHAWHSWFIVFYVRTFGMVPWANANEVPPGDFYDGSGETTARKKRRASDDASGNEGGAQGS